MKKKLAILSIFTAVTTTASALDLELKGGLDVYTWASEKFSTSGVNSEAFTSTYNLNQPAQNFAGSAQLNYNVVDNLHLGLNVGISYDKSFEGKTSVAVEYLDAAGNNKTSTAVTTTGGSTFENGSFPNFEVKNKGGFFNIPVSLAVKYDLPLFLGDYALNLYLIGKAGYNFPVSNEDSSENKNFSNTFANFAYGAGLGMEYYGFQLEALFNGLSNNYVDAKASAETVSKITLSSITVGDKRINKSYSRMGISITAGYRFQDLL